MSDLVSCSFSTIPIIMSLLIQIIYLYYFNPVGTSDHSHHENTPNLFHLDHAVIERVRGDYYCPLRMMYMCCTFKGNVNHIDMKL